MIYILLVILTNFNGIALQFYRIAVELHRSAKKQRCILIASRGCNCVVLNTCAFAGARQPRSVSRSARQPPSTSSPCRWTVSRPPTTRTRTCRRAPALRPPPASMCRNPSRPALSFPLLPGRRHQPLPRPRCPSQLFWEDQLLSVPNQIQSPASRV